eukprot:12631068-Alexandrium_andersonii.AAC.1
MCIRDRLDPEAARRASQRFPTSTAESVDGFRVRRYAMLPRKGRAAVALLLMVVERFGERPRQLRAILAAPIPKATKGYRAVGVMVSLYRV